MPMLRSHRAASALLVTALASFVPAQIDAPGLHKRAAAAASAVQQAQQKCLQAVQAVRDAIGDPENKVQSDCTDMANVLNGGAFDGALGGLPIALEHLEYVAEERRAATRTAMLALREQLTAGSVALQRHEALQELASRLEYLDGFGADTDTSAALTDLAASAGKATRSRALPRAELAQLQQQLARRRQQNDERLGKELADQAKTELAQLQQDVASMRAEMTSPETETRDRGFSRFDEAARSIRTALARVPAKDRTPLADELARLTAPADATYQERYATATLQRAREAWEFTADQFAGWQEEAATITTQGYLDFEPPNVDVLVSPRTVALVGRVNAWVAFFGQDPDYVRNRSHTEVAAFGQSLQQLRDAAHQKLLPLAKTVVDGLGALEIADDRIRGRLQTLADWDLPIALQVHPELTGLRARIHAVLDAHDRKTLGDEKALATIREQALVAADGLWPRLCACLPVEGGFEPATSSLFVGRLMRLEGVWLRTDEFASAPGEIVFDLGGHVFVGQLPPRVQAEVKAARQRLQLPGESLGADEPCELLAVVGPDAERTLLGPQGAQDALVVPARALTIVGVRQGALFTVAP